MIRLAGIAAVAVLMFTSDVPQVLRFRPSTSQAVESLHGESLPVLPDLSPVADGTKPVKDKTDDRLSPESRLAIVRYVSGEFARALKPLPAGKKGFRVKVGEPVDEKALHQAVANNGPAVSTGDTVQITKLEFHDHEIVLDLNGGGRGKTRFRDRVHVDIGGVPRVSSTPTNPAPGYQGTGATLYLDFGRPVPDMSPDELKKLLGGMLDFSKQRSAAVQWAETLPPEVQKAIKEKRAVVGMDREMVVAALGRPERKVRERDEEGNEVEDWIYGQPPQKTVFVRFSGERVTSVRQYP